MGTAVGAGAASSMSALRAGADDGGDLFPRRASTQGDLNEPNMPDLRVGEDLDGVPAPGVRLGYPELQEVERQRPGRDGQVRGTGGWLWIEWTARIHRLWARHGKLIPCCG